MASTNARRGKEFIQDGETFLFSLPLAQHVCLRSMAPIAMAVFDHLDKLKSGPATSPEVFAGAVAKLTQPELPLGERNVPFGGAKAHLGERNVPFRQTSGSRKGAKRREDKLLSRVRSAVNLAVLTSAHTASGAWNVVRSILVDHDIIKGHDGPMIPALRESKRASDIVREIEVALNPPRPVQTNQATVQ